MFIIVANPIIPLRTIGRSTILLKPTMAVSGLLMTGVVAMPPSAPRLVMVMVEPRRSCGEARPARGGNKQCEL